MTTSVSDRIKAGRTKRRDYRDVDVVLDGHVSDDVEALEQQIETHEQEIAGLEEEKRKLHPQAPTRPTREQELDAQITTIQETIAGLEEQRDDLRGGTITTLRFERLDGDRWAQLTAEYPARVDVAVDRISGYNYQAVARAAAPLCGYALGENDTREDLTAEDWAGLYEIISGREAENIASSLWELNDFAVRRRIDAARKGSSDGSGSRSS